MLVFIVVSCCCLLTCYGYVLQQYQLSHHIRPPVSVSQLITPLYAKDTQWQQCNTNFIHKQQSRFQFMQSTIETILFSSIIAIPHQQTNAIDFDVDDRVINPILAAIQYTTTSSTIIQHPFQYSTEWVGTNLPVLDLQSSVLISNILLIPENDTVVSASPKNHAQQKQPQYRWQMAKWPDPVLRRPATPVSNAMLGTNVLYEACNILQNTALYENAVGLAAQQCGIDARIICLSKQQKQSSVIDRRITEYSNQNKSEYMILINPKIIRRSSEMNLRIWNESCLVLPPTFHATVLRDDWVDVAYQDYTYNYHNHNIMNDDNYMASWKQIRMNGEMARTIQHEMDHDRGILVTDHVSLDELENAIMRQIEQPNHNERMTQAYNRYIN